MATVRAGMTMSLDGFVNDAGSKVGALYPNMDELRDSELLRESGEQTAAVLMGRRTYAMADDPDWYADNYEYQVPIFVLTHEAPKKHPKENDKLTFTFVTDGLESAVAQARAAAGDKRVTVVGGPNTVRQLLGAGLVDELEVGIVPVLLGEGLRHFEHLGTEAVRLEKVKVTETGQRTDILFRVLKRADRPQRGR